MNFNRVYGMVLRYFYHFRHSYDRISDAFYWPTMDLIVWGLTSSYLNSFLPDASQYVLIVISGILFWIIIWRGQYEITVNLLEDLWNKNLINIFAAPLKVSEWLVSFIIVGIIKAFLSFSFACIVAYILYKINIFAYGFSLLPIIVLLIMSGWAVGFFVAGIILRYGTRVQTFAWTIVVVFSPFSAIYYPVSILPHWAQAISWFIPTSYVFEAAREVIRTGYLDNRKLLLSFILNVAYLILSLIFFRKSFDKTLQKGLVKVY